MAKTTAPSPRLLAPEHTLPLALGISVVLHGLLLAINFTFPDVSRSFKEQALEIVLVNSKTHQRPVDAQARAQVNNDGGGNTDADRRAATPTPQSPRHQEGSELEQRKQRVRELEATQQKLLADTRNKRAATPEVRKTPQTEAETPLPNGQDLAASSLAMTRLQGEISRSVEEYNKRPRKVNIGLRTTEYRLAQYREDWRIKVEKVGTLNYPEEARGRLYGSLTFSVTIAADGSLVDITIDRPSGHKVLDDAARRILRLAAPYGALPPSLRKDYDQIEITATLSFDRGDTVAAAPR